MTKKGPNSKPGSGGKSLNNWSYYRAHQDRLREYHRTLHWQWRGMKVFAKATGMGQAEARRYIDSHLKSFYLDTGLLPELRKREYAKRRTGKVWRPEDEN